MMHQNDAGRRLVLILGVVPGGRGARVTRQRHQRGHTKIRVYSPGVCFVQQLSEERSKEYSTEEYVFRRRE